MIPFMSSSKNNKPEKTVKKEPDEDWLFVTEP
jgi:hypothetical protein